MAESTGSQKRIHKKSKNDARGDLEEAAAAKRRRIEKNCRKATIATLVDELEMSAVDGKIPKGTMVNLLATSSAKQPIDI
jgi:hypothetical protein